MVWYMRYLYPLVSCYITMENHHFKWIFPWNMVDLSSSWCESVPGRVSCRWSNGDPLLSTPWRPHICRGCSNISPWTTSKRSIKLHNRMTWAGRSSLIPWHHLKKTPMKSKFQKKNTTSTSFWGFQECLQSTAGGRCPAAPTTAAREGGSAIGSSYGSPFWAGWGLVMWTLVYKAHE